MLTIFVVMEMRKTILTGTYILLILTAFVRCGSNDSSEANKEKTTEELIGENLGTTMKFEEMPDTLQVAHLVRVWNGCHSMKFLDNLAELYASNLFFYGENRSKSDCINIKRQLFQKYPDYFQRIIGGINVTQANPDEYRCNFTKYISVGRITAPVPAYIIFRKSGDNQWEIIAESDPETDIRAKNLKDSLQVLMDMYMPSSSEIKGNFSGKGNETIYIFPPDNPNCTDCTTGLFFSNELLPPLEIAHTKSVNLLNEGDLDGDGADEFSVLSGQNTNGKITVYSFKRGSWVKLAEFNVNYARLEQDTEERKNAIQFAGSGYIFVNEWKGDSTVQEKVNIWNY